MFSGNLPGKMMFVLHAHLPYVRHPENDRHLEERWLFEAITETYIPLLRAMEHLEADGVRFKLTMSLTPTLLAMLEDELLRHRYLRFLDEHLGRWVRPFTAAVSSGAQSAFYRELAELTDRFVRMESGSTGGTT